MIEARGSLRTRDDLVVLFTAGNYGNVRVWRHFRDEMLPQDIIAAIHPAR